MANVSKSAVIVFAKDIVDGSWRWGEHMMPTVSKYTYLGIDFMCNRAWDKHIKKVVDRGENQLRTVLSNWRAERANFVVSMAKFYVYVYIYIYIYI